MSDRLNELRRQRALVKEHLDWLDAQIAATPGTTKSAPIPAQAATSQLSSSASRVSPIISVSLTETPSAHDTEALLQKYANDPKDSEASVKRGCWIAFLAAFAFLGLVVATWYFLGVYAS